MAVVGRAVAAAACVLAGGTLHARSGQSQPAPASLAAPVPSACISSPFGPRRAAGPHAALFHNGIDFPAAAGTWVHPAAPGSVVAVRRLGSTGLEIDVAHLPPSTGASGFLTRYAHLGTVAPGIAEGRTEVGPATPLGRVGRTGITYGTHVHVELHLNGRPVDPEPFFSAVRCDRR